MLGDMLRVLDGRTILLMSHREDDLARTDETITLDRGRQCVEASGQFALE